jgi:hypothetical protein
LARVQKKKKFRKKTLAASPSTLWCVRHQGCQMVCFQTKNPKLCKFWWALDWKMFIYCLAIWNILRIFYEYLVHLCSFGTFFPVLVSCTKKNLATLCATIRQAENKTFVDIFGAKKSGKKVDAAGVARWDIFKPKIPI